jgi:lysophospholipase L1-like esterase
MRASVRWVGSGRRHTPSVAEHTVEPRIWQSFVALGDSFTEGLYDVGPDGSMRGWADRVAERLARDAAGFRYANLAIRGRRMHQIRDEQVPYALGMRPQLVSLAGGVNDILRPRVDLGTMTTDLVESVAALRGGGAEVLLFRIGDPSRRYWVVRGLLPRILALNAAVDHAASAFGCRVVDLWSPRIFDDHRVWSDDRLHLNSAGHARVAGAVLELLGYDSGAWRQLLPEQHPVPVLRSLRSDAAWARQHFAPWVARRLTGRSIGEGLPPKRPVLEPYGVPGVVHETAAG